MKFQDISIYWLASSLLDWSVIILALLLPGISPWLIPVSILIIGNRQHALAILAHDGAHQLVVPKNRRLNDFLTNLLTMFPLGLSLKQYRKFHWQHHRYVGSDKDPELPLKETPIPMEGRFTYRVYLHAIIDLFGGGILHVLRFLIYIRPRAFSECGAIIFQGVAILAFVISGLWWIPTLWFVALPTSFWACFRLRVWSEHVGGLAGQTLVFNANWIERLLFLPHGSEYHHEHHENPGIPFHKLGDSRVIKASTSLIEAQLQGIYRTNCPKYTLSSSDIGNNSVSDK